MDKLNSCIVAVCVACLTVGGCGGQPRTGKLSDLDPPKRDCDTPTTVASAQYRRTQPGIKGMQEVRPQLQTLQRAVDKAALRAAPLVKSERVPTGTPLTRPIEVLCLSGGGQYGAFGAGFLKGWARDSRPAFDIVTGISTGSMISTFAFLGGPDHDDALENAYLDAAVGEPVFTKRALLAALTSNSLATREGLEHRLETTIRPELLREVAAHADNRTLLVGTVNLDTGQMTYWNLTRLARLGVDFNKLERATELYRRILLAATAIPAALPPVMINRDDYKDFFDAEGSDCRPLVSPDWIAGTTMHCDGGARQNIFAVDLSNAMVDLKGTMEHPAVNVYLIGNGTIDDDAQFTRDGLLPIAERAVNVLLTEAMRGNIATIAYLGEKRNWHLHLAYLHLSPECAEKLPGSGMVDAFNREFMECIMQEGERRGAGVHPRWDDVEALLGIPR